jgi:hypothetical protein
MPKLLFFSIFCLLTGFADAQTHSQLKQEERNKALSNPDAEQRSSQDRLNKNTNQNPQTLSTFLSNMPASSSIRNYPIVNYTPKISLEDDPVFSPVSSIKIIDGRFDVNKVSFLPVINDVQKKGYASLGMQFVPSFTGWLKSSFIERAIATDSNSKRQLLLVIKKYWFSNSVDQPYAAANPKLITALEYQFEIYTSLDIGYYPQKIIKGNFSTLYNGGKAYSELSDSVLVVLKKELTRQNFSVRETEANWQSPVDFNDYYNERIRKTAHFENMPKGLYESYTDFLDKKPVCDSVDMAVKYTNYERVPLYACQLNAFKDGQHIAGNKSWGYFDGFSLFVNTGNGFYIKLIRSKDDYVFFDLKSIRQDQIKSTILDGIQIGNSPYPLLKDYTKAYALTYQLDLDTGKLY